MRGLFKKNETCIHLAYIMYHQHIGIIPLSIYHESVA